MIADGRYLEMLWGRYRLDPQQVPVDWRNAFQFVELFYGDPLAGAGLQDRRLHPDAGAALAHLRRFGHRHADLDPLGLEPAEPIPDPVCAMAPESALHAYAGSMAVETGHLDSPEMSEWVASFFEAIHSGQAEPDLAAYKQLLETEVFDRFLAVKYPAKKRFGSEGADALLPLLHAIRQEAAVSGIDELVIGSMHRGRLSILTNFLGADLTELLGRFGGQHPFPDQQHLHGDLSYHMGHEADIGGVRCVLLPNPSHLEAVNPVVVGYARARRAAGRRAMALIIHTDASVVGQGVNAELLQMSALRGFEVGGVVHVVINNQIGFTTNPRDARTSRYCTGTWRAVDSLLVHVNGDDVDAVLRSGRFAMAYRREFQRDAVIDLVCYRSNGHNEIDEPRFTQPRYYAAADAKPGVVRRYEDRLIAAGRLTANEAQAQRAAIKATLDEAFGRRPLERTSAMLPRTQPAASEKPSVPPVSETWLREIAAGLGDIPPDIGHPKLIRLMQRRTGEVDTGITWAFAEAMAFACALRAGVSVRLCGQDFERGPFSQRHLAVIHPEDEARHQTLQGFATAGAATFEVVDSPLSEYAVLGFEYGHSLAARSSLCVWEAQFGDFANGAQIMIDQFIASGWEKWRQTSSLTVLLPHGLEGQGPEHSSARIERLLQLCAGDNITVAQPSTPANYFHLLYAQALTGARPLFILTPKVLLRLPQARSALADFIDEARFTPVILSGAKARRAVLCSGKIAYELEQERGAEDKDVAVVRLESFYPFPAEALAGTLRKASVEQLVWLQEEPENFGAGAWIMPRLAAVAEQTGAALLPMVARGASASPAGSFHGHHDRDQRRLLRRALNMDSKEGLVS